MAESPHDLEHHQLLSEILKYLPMAVVSDTQTTWSRTCWLSSSLEDRTILVVLDSVTKNQQNLLTIDAWSNLGDVDSAIQSRLLESRLAENSESCSQIQIDWDIGLKTESVPQLIVNLASDPLDNVSQQDVFVTVSISDMISEDVVLSIPLGEGTASISLELDWSLLAETPKLQNCFFSINVKDSSWKPISKAYRHMITWRKALETQIFKKLEAGVRFESFPELADHLGLSFHQHKDLIGNLFFDYCLEKTPTKCGFSRTENYCQRAAFLIGLVTCFNPTRGLSGYLKMITEDTSLQLVRRLGTLRTWREHISEVANIAEDFRPTQVKLMKSRKISQRGRPPTQLIPRTPLTSLFKRFMDASSDYICSNCRFRG
ncbi:MAG: hypothetical protein ACFFDQ_11805 [Candidatus Thorarchaeota archaeon]